MGEAAVFDGAFDDGDGGGAGELFGPGLMCDHGEELE